MCLLRFVSALRWSLLFAVLFALGCTSARTAGVAAPRASSFPMDRGAAVIPPQFLQLPLSFEPNRGQADPSAQFLARGPGYGVALTPTGALLGLASNTTIGDRRTSRIIGVRFEGADPQARAAGLRRLPGTVSYFLGSAPKKWRTGIATFERVRYSAVYPGVDVVYYGNQRQLEYDFLIRPGADPRQIRLQFEGVDGVDIAANGDLLLRAGQGTLRHHRPVVYQVVNGRRVMVGARYVLASTETATGGADPRLTVSAGRKAPVARRVTFQLARFDATRPLVIDPVLSYSTYLGGSGNDAVFGVAAGLDGSTYLTGSTASADFPLMSPFQGSYGGGDTNAFVAKVNAAGTALIYSTYLGGAGGATAEDVAVDGSGQAYVVGSAGPGFPVTGGAFDPSANGNGDAFVTKLSASGTALVYSTYVGGANVDAALDLDLAADGALYVGGHSNSNDLPATPGAFRTFRISGHDGFLAKIAPDGAALTYLTYLGGGDEDRVVGIAADTFGSVCVGVQTASLNLPVTSGAAQTSYGGGTQDGYLAALNAAGSTLLYGTYLGGSSTDFLNDVALDSAGNAYAVGVTHSGDFPAGTVLGTRGGADAFLTKLNPSGTARVYSTLLAGSTSTFSGGPAEDEARSIAVESNGSVWVVGRTDSADFPTTSDAAQATAGGFADAFAARLSSTGTVLLYSTFLGGSLGDGAWDVALDSTGAVHVAGQTGSHGFTGGSIPFPTMNPVQGTFHGILDGFLARLTPARPGKPTGLTATALSQTTVRLSWSAGTGPITGFEVERKSGGSGFGAIGGTGGTTTTLDDTSTVASTTYVYRVLARNHDGVSQPSDEVEVTTPPNPPAAPASLTATAISHSRIDLTWTASSGATTYTVKRSTTAGGPYSDVASGVVATSFSNTGLAAATTYYYVVAATNAGGSSGNSSEASATTLPSPPPAPGSLTATTVSQTRIDLNWSGSSGATGYTVKRSTVSGGPYTTIATGLTGTTYSSSGLAPATPYFYVVTATNAGGESGSSNEASASTLPDPPAVPVNLTATPNSSTGMVVGWTDASTNEEGFILERKSVTGEFGLVVRTGAGVAGYLDTGLAPDTTYTYRVRAYNAGGESANSEVASATTPPGPPSAPTNVSATSLSQTRIDLTWSASAGATGYRVRRASATGGPYSTIASDVTGTAYSDTGLSAATRYFYVVTATNAGGESPLSSEASAVTLPAPPAPPTNLTATVISSGQIDLQWTDNANNGEGSEVERKEAGGEYATIGRSSSIQGGFPDLTVTAGKTYTYRVRVYNAGGSSDYSNEASATPPVPSTPPTAPVNLTATVRSATEILLRWEDLPGDLVGHVIEMREGTEGPFGERMRTGGVTAGPNAIVVNGLRAGTTYSFQVKAYNAAGESPYSNEASATTTALPPPGLASLSISPAKVTGGQKATGTVSLTSPAPEGGTTVTLKHRGAGRSVGMVGSVTVPEGEISIAFEITSKRVSYKVTANVTATLGEVKKLAKITVTPRRR